MMSKMGCACGSELRTGSSTPDAEARIRKSAALKIRARPSLSSTFGPTRTVPIGMVGPRSIAALADLGRPRRPARVTFLPLSPFNLNQRNATPALRIVVFTYFLSEVADLLDRRPRHAPVTKLDESRTQSKRSKCLYLSLYESGPSALGAANASSWGRSRSPRCCK